MIRFTVRTLMKNKILWSWPALVFLSVAAIFTWGDISSAQNSYSFIIHLGELKIPAGLFINQFLLSLITLIAIISMPSHFAANLNPRRAALLLSKPISRSEMYLSDFAAMLVTSVLYSLLTILLLAVLVGIKAAIFPYQLFLGLLILLPLILFCYYLTITLFLLLFNSYLAAVVLGYFLTGFSSLLLNIEPFLQLIGWDGTLGGAALTACTFIIPSSGGFQQLMENLLAGGFAVIDGGLLLFALTTCLPFGLLGFYFFQKEEF